MRTNSYQNAKGGIMRTLEGAHSSHQTTRPDKASNSNRTREEIPQIITEWNQSPGTPTPPATITNMPVANAHLGCHI